MIALKLFLYFLLLYRSVSSRPVEEELEHDGQLVFLQTIWRHGDRTPVFVWPNDPNQEQTWPQGLGQLTNEGLQQQVKLGRKLRQLYGGIVSEEYNSREIYVRSSDVNRTILSAVANMIGFFREVQTSNQLKDWPKGYQPVPIHTVPEEYDFMRSLMQKGCKRFKELVALIQETPEYMTISEANKGLLQKVQEVTGDKNISFDKLGLVADTWQIEKCYNRPETPGFGKELLDLIEPIAFKVNNFKYGLELKPFKGVDIRLESAKMRGGMLLWAMIENMQQKTKCVEASATSRSKGDMPYCIWMNRLKYYAFSAHDNTIASLFATLGFPKTNYKSDGYPSYAACLAVELRKHHQTQTYYVKLNYIVGETITDVTADITGCPGSTCTLEQFVNRSKDYRIDDVKQYCVSPLYTPITDN